MSTEHHEQDLRAALNRLGSNLHTLGQKAWDSPERHQMQSELQGTLKELEGNLQQAGQEFRQSEVGQQLKRDLERIKEDFDSGELEMKARLELVKLLAQLNERLETWLQGEDQGDA